MVLDACGPHRPPRGGRARAGRRYGEKLLLDALRPIVDASGLLGCLGIIVDADEAAERFHVGYDFVTWTRRGWPRRMFLAVATAKSALER